MVGPSFLLFYTCFDKLVPKNTPVAYEPRGCFNILNRLAIYYRLCRCPTYPLHRPVCEITRSRY
nr:MAG TPA: hypothetical protein [Caudoviricetes sp.]